MKSSTTTMKIPSGVIIRQSQYSVKESIDRLESFLTQHGATIYARIDQQDELKKVGLDILALEFILFGNPKAGGAIMIENPIAALDLPLKIIAWEDSDKKVWIAFNEPGYIEDRYSLQQKETTPLNLSPLVKNVLNLGE
jgi:uncharacterized protein (DUF302 family)